MEVDPVDAVRRAHSARPGETERVDVIGNYTAFDELLGDSVACGDDLAPAEPAVADSAPVDSAPRTTGGTGS
jgi:hypothetical protein